MDTDKQYGKNGRRQFGKNFQRKDDKPQIAALLDRQPPYSQDSEVGVLGSMMLMPTNIDDVGEPFGCLHLCSTVSTSFPESVHVIDESLLPHAIEAKRSSEYRDHGQQTGERNLHAFGFVFGLSSLSARENDQSRNACGDSDSCDYVPAKRCSRTQSVSAPTLVLQWDC